MMLPSSIYFVCVVASVLAMDHGCKDEKEPTRNSRDMSEEQIETIPRTELESSLTSGGRVALIRVIRSEVLRPGTRSEQTVVFGKVEAVLHGELDEHIELTRYTSGGDPVLDAGLLYIVAVEEVARFNPRLLLSSYVNVPPEKKSAYLEAHRRLISDLGY